MSRRRCSWIEVINGNNQNWHRYFEHRPVLAVCGEAAGLFAKQNIAVEIINQLDEEKVVEDIVSQTDPDRHPQRAVADFLPAQRQ